MNSVVVHLALALFGTVGSCILIWRLADPDPKHLRAALGPQELLAAERRVQWAESMLAALAGAASMHRAPSLGMANVGAHYIPLRHRVCVSHAFLARLSDAELQLILAHEVGHAARRWKTFFRAGGISEEVLADRLALRIASATPEQWLHTVLASIAAEPSLAMNLELERRALALCVVYSPL